MGGGRGSGGVGLSSAAAQTMRDANLSAIPSAKKVAGGNHTEFASQKAVGSLGRPPLQASHSLAHCVSYDDRLRQNNSSDEEGTATTSDMTRSTASINGLGDSSVYQPTSNSSKRRLPGRHHKCHDSSMAPRHIPKGLKNVGNTCYANAAIQCLLATVMTHSLLDPTQAVLFRRYSSNPNILAQGSGSVDSADEDYEADQEIGLALDDDVPSSPSEEEKAKKREERRRKREARRKEKEKMELRETCRWLTAALTSVTREYTTINQQKHAEEQPPPPPPPAGLFGLFSMTNHSPLLQKDKRKVVDPGEITRNVHKLSQTLRPYQQEDAHEFLRSLLSTLTMEGQNRQLSSLFDGLLESSVTCQTCNYPSLTRDRYMDLSLDIADSSITNLTEALAHFTKTEKLDKNNMVECRKCQDRRVVTKGLRLATAPTILVCHLKRFAWNLYGQQMRLNKDVKFPLQLDISNYMSRANRSRPPPYELVGVLVHAGRTCDSGHYYSFVRSGDSWYKCNDATVTEVDVDVVLRQKAYMLVYEVEGMREKHDCESYGKYHPAPVPPSTSTRGLTKSNSYKTKVSSPKTTSKSKKKKKGHFRSQSAPRPVREPSPFRGSRFPAPLSPLNNLSQNGNGHPSEDGDGVIASALNSMLNACSAASNSLCGFSADVSEPSGIPHEVNLPTDSQDSETLCSGDATHSTEAEPDARMDRQERSTRPPLTPPRSGSEPPRARTYSTAVRSATGSLLGGIEDEREYYVPSQLAPDIVASTSSSKKSETSSSSKKSRRRRKSNKSDVLPHSHHPRHLVDDPRQGDSVKSGLSSDEQQRIHHRLKGLDLVLKKKSVRRNKERPPLPEASD